MNFWKNTARLVLLFKTVFGIMKLSLEIFVKGESLVVAELIKKGWVAICGMVQ